MAIYNIAVVLWQWGPPVFRQDKSWYEDYFFNPISGQAAYWLKQSAGDVVLAGQVFDWVFDTDARRDFSNRANTARFVVDLMENEHGVHFRNCQSIVVVLGIPTSMTADGSSASVVSTSGAHHALVTRIGDSFGFVCHELGHGILGRPHSFTWDTAYQVVGEYPGGYGHPHCIMSAQAYGGFAQATHDDLLPRGAQPEYHAIGPSLNGVAARARGWIDTYELALSPGFVAEFTIRSRQWMGRDSAQWPQGIHVTKPDGNDYVIEFYESLGWDSGLSHPHLILTQDKGGLADFHYPTAHSGTYIDSIPLAPASLTGPDAVINDVGSLGIMPVSYDPGTHSLRVKVSSAFLSGGLIDMSQARSSVSRSVDHGSVTFKPGERFCIVGTWSFDWIEQSETITIDASHPRGYGAVAGWTIDSRPLPPEKTTFLTHKHVMVADPIQLDITAYKLVEIGYKIEPTPLGSRLTLTNRPQDESYSVDIGVTLTTDVASGSQTTTVNFSGRECRFPPEFYKAWSDCTARFLKQKLHDSQHIVVFDPSLIHRIHPEFEHELVGWLGGLAHLLDQGDRQGFEVAAAALRRRLRLPAAKLLVVDRSDIGDFPPISENDGPIPPAAKLSRTQRPTQS